MKPRSLLPILSGLIAAGATPEQARSALAPCEWCGQVHPRLELCPPRPLARGLSRRSFLQLGAAVAIGAMLPPLQLVGDVASEVVGTFDVSEWDSILKEVYAPGILKQLNEESLLMRWMDEHRDQPLEPGAVVPIRMGRNR